MVVMFVQSGVGSSLLGVALASSRGVIQRPASACLSQYAACTSTVLCAVCRTDSCRCVRSATIADVIPANTSTDVLTVIND
jgi:hypothetical protein